MSKKTILVIGVIVALISCAAISGCTDSSQKPGEETLTPTPKPGETPDVSETAKSPQEIVAESNNAFAFSLYRLLQQKALMMKTFSSRRILFQPHLPLFLKVQRQILLMRLKTSSHFQRVWIH